MRSKISAKEAQKIFVINATLLSVADAWKELEPHIKPGTREGFHRFMEMLV